MNIITVSKFKSPLKIKDSLHQWVYTACAVSSIRFGKTLERGDINDIVGIVDIVARVS